MNTPQYIPSVSNFLPAAAGEPVTMSSREIAELVEARHDSVKRTVERLAERGVIGLPPMVEYLDSLGRKATEYRIGKRDSYVIVAQLSPEFTARLVDRWQELEAQTKPRDPMELLNDPAAMRGILLSYSEKVLELEGTVKALGPKAEALDRIEAADGSFCITDAAKTLQMRPKDLFTYLRQNGWIYRRVGGESEVGYQSKIVSGYLEHKTTTVLRGDGSEKVTTQVRVTPKGLTTLAKLIGPTLGEVRS
jgi:phage regulator Rha-like protein/phage antirepressor YoqD-like protein